MVLPCLRQCCEVFRNVKICKCECVPCVVQREPTNPPSPSKMLRRLLFSVQKKLSQQFQPVTYYYTTPSVETTPTATASSSSKSILENPARNLPKPNGQSYSTLMSNAERCVDPGSVTFQQANNKSQVLDLISLKKLLSSNPEMKKLIVKLAESLQQIGEVRHPFVSTAGDLFFGDSPPILTPGLLVLLISKLAGHRISASSSYAPKGDIYFSGAASDRQILLARGVVLNAAAYELHRTVLETVEPFAGNLLDESKIPALHQGNKMAILTGDMLVVNTVRSISSIENNRVFGLMMNTVVDFAIAEHQTSLPFRKLPNGKLRFTPPESTPYAESDLLAAGFRCAMMLAGHSESVQEQASKLGTAVGALWKVNYDLNKYTKEKSTKLDIENREEMKQFLYESGVEASKLVALRDEELNLANSTSEVNQTLLELIRYWAIAEPAAER